MFMGRSAKEKHTLFFIEPLVLVRLVGCHQPTYGPLIGIFMHPPLKWGPVGLHMSGFPYVHGLPIDVVLQLNCKCLKLELRNFLRINLAM